MKMDIIAGSGKDEFYTPAYAVKVLLPYLKAGKKVWCPFDTEDSLFVKILRDYGMDVVNTHIEYGQDFFELEVPEGTDYIISNPPYSMKTEVLERLFALEIPFAMLLGVVGIFESHRRFNLFKHSEFEIMYLNKRVSYMEDYTSNATAKNPPFSSVYICSKLLPAQTVFEVIDKTDISYGTEEVTE